MDDQVNGRRSGPSVGWPLVPALLVGLSVGLTVFVAESAGASQSEVFVLTAGAAVAFALVAGRIGLLDRQQYLGDYAAVLLLATIAALVLTFAAGVSGALTAAALFLITAACQFKTYRRVRASQSGNRPSA